MLQFIFGLPLSGKTYTILDKAKKLSVLGLKSVIIVPEQASFETEKAVLKSLGDSLALNVQVLSFSRLYDDICREIGGISAKVLKDSDKIIFMNKALKQIAPELKLWGKYSKSLTFAKTMLDTVGEFKINGISAQEIKEKLPNTSSQSLKSKLQDLSLIYETYDLLIAERYIDPADRLTKLYYNLENHRYFNGKTVFIDGFKGFTGQQFKILDRIFTQADDVYVSLTNNASFKKEYDVFTNIRSAVMRIEDIAKSHNVKIAEPIILNRSFYNHSGLTALEKLLSDNPVGDIEAGAVYLCKAKTVFDEAEFAARTIRKLVRTENYRFRDFVIIARDSDKYAQAIEYACNKNGVECFFDKKVPLLSFPLSVAALSAIKALDFSSENIFRFHKSGIGLLTTEEISTLENYTYLWNITGDIWLDNWDMDVRGFVTDELDENATKELERINELRQKAILPILNFKHNFKDNAMSMAKAIFNLFKDCNASDSLKLLCQKFEGQDVFSADVLKQSYDLFMNVLDSLVSCFAEQSLSRTAFYDALNLALSLEEVGIIPQTIDQVVFGQADRIRPSNPKIAFILGANQGVFPKFADNKGVFAVKERKELINLDLKIADNEIYSSIDENFLVYCNLCCPSERIYISYSTQTLKSEALTPSAFVSAITDKLNPIYFEEPSKTLEDTIPETLESAFSQFCRNFAEKENFETIKQALEDSISTESLIHAVSDEKLSISKENARKLFGENIYMSATRFDNYNRCKFSYFCKYGLKLKRLQPADFDVLQRGTIVHFVLEKIISTYKDGIKDLSKEELDSLCDRYLNEYLDLVTGYRTIQNARHEFLLGKISRALKEVVYHLSLEFAQSDFKPTHCELKIGGEEGIPLEFGFDSGKIFLSGSIDRVDQYNGYIRIVDYKTGSKSFKLPDILFGLNLQMLIYLYAVIRGQNLPDDRAAGIFYMPSKRDLNNEGMAMNGLVKGDSELLKAMEKENNGEFVPKISFNKDGSISKTSNSFITEEDFSKIFDHIEALMKKTGNSLSNGEIEINPTDGRESAACDYCDFKSVCGVENDIAFKVPNLSNSDVFEALVKEDKNGI